MQKDREHPRYAHEAVVRIRAGGGEIEGRTTNVSRGGLCADLAHELAFGTEVELAIQLVFEEDVQSEPLSIGARVVWVTSVDDGFQIGLAFKPMRAEQAEYLTMFLRYLDDSGPRTKQPKVKGSVDDRFR